MASRQLNKLIKSLKRTNTIGTSTADQLRSIERASNQRSQGWKSILDQKYKPSFEEKLFDLGAATIDSYPAVSDQREANLHNRMSNFTTLLSGITNEQALHNLGQNFNNTLGAVGNNADLRLLASAFKNEYDKKKQEMSNFNLGMQQLSGFYGEATELQPSDVQGFKLDQVRTKLDSIRRSKQLLSGGAIINQQGSPVGLNWSANDEFKDADGNVLNQEEMLRKVNQYEGTILKSVEALMRDGIITEKELEFIISPDSTYKDFLNASNSAMSMANTNANKTGSVANALLSKSQQIAKFLAQSKYKASDGLDEATMNGVQDIISEESGFENAQSLSEDSNFSKQYLNQTQGNYSSADVLDDYNPETATMFETDLYELADYYKRKSDSFRDMETIYQALGHKWSPHQDIVPTNLMNQSPAQQDSYDYNDPFNNLSSVETEDFTYLTSPNGGVSNQAGTFSSQSQADQAMKANQDSILELASGYSPTFASYLTGDLSEKDMREYFNNIYGNDLAGKVLQYDQKSKVLTLPGHFNTKSLSDIMMNQINTIKDMYEKGIPISKIENMMALNPELDKGSEFYYYALGMIDEMAAPEGGAGAPIRGLGKWKRDNYGQGKYDESFPFNPMYGSMEDFEKHMQEQFDFDAINNQNDKASKVFMDYFKGHVKPLFSNIGELMQNNDKAYKIFDDQLEKFLFNKTQGSMISAIQKGGIPRGQIKKPSTGPSKHLYDKFTQQQSGAPLYASGERRFKGYSGYYKDVSNNPDLIALQDLKKSFWKSRKDYYDTTAAHLANDADFFKKWKEKNIEKYIQSMKIVGGFLGEDLLSTK